jgi:hypothetical protein
VEHESHNEKADALGGEMRQVHAEPRRGVAGHLAEVAADAPE